jgi:phosphoglycolate phosphatase
MKRNALVFDLDGTLIDSVPDLQAALNEVLRELGKPPLPQDMVRGMIGDGTAALVARGLAASQVPADALAECLPRFLALYEADPVSRTRPYPGVPQVLANLAAEGRRLAICTNKPQKATLAVLSGLGLDGLFSAVVGGDVLPVKKPDPGHVIGAITALAATIDEAVMIGDSENDVAAAQAAGVPVVLVRYGYARVPLADLAADIQIDDFLSLPAALATFER